MSKFTNLLKQTFILLVLVFVFAGPFQLSAQSDQPEPIFTGAVRSIRWSQDSQSLIFQGRLRNDDFEHGVDVTDQSWHQYDVATQSLTQGNHWPLQPTLSGEELQLFNPFGNSFIFLSPDERYIIYDNADGPTTLGDRLTGQLFLTSIPASTSRNTDVFSVMWSEDSSLFVLATYATVIPLPLIRYGTHYTADVASTQVQYAFPTIGDEEYVPDQVYDISADGRLLLFLGQPLTSQHQILLVWDTADSAGGYTVEARRVIGASFVPGDESKLLFVNEEGLVQYDLATGTEVILRTNINSEMADMAVFSPDGQYVTLLNRITHLLYVVETNPPPIANAAPQANPFEETFENPECQHWCWLGIEPGVTTHAEVEVILTTNGVSYVTAEHENHWFYTVYWGIDNPNLLFPFAGQFNATIVSTDWNGVVDRILTDVSNLSVETTLGYMDRAPDAIVDFFNPIIIYRDLGVEFEVEEENFTEIMFIALYPPEYIDHELSAPGVVDMQPCTEPANLCSIPTATP